MSYYRSVLFNTNSIFIHRIIRLHFGFQFLVHSWLPYIFVNMISFDIDINLCTCFNNDRNEIIFIDKNVSNLKVGLSPPKKICVICLMESPLKMMKNAFYFVLKALFALKIFKFLSRFFGHLGKTA